MKTDSERGLFMPWNKREPLLGYYTSVFGEVVAGSAVGGMDSSRYPRPALLIALLAVDHAFHNCGIGSLLVKIAVTNALEASEVTGLELVRVEAIDDAFFLSIQDLFSPSLIGNQRGCF